METAMNEVTFLKATRESLEPLLERYLLTLTGVTDDYWEEHILGACFYEIRECETSIGCFAVYGESRLTLFYLLPERIVLAQPLFAEILRRCSTRNAFAATCDELLLSLCLDFHESVGMQAYFFDGSTPYPVCPAEYSREFLTDVLPMEIEMVNRETENFFHDVTREQLESGVVSLHRLAVNGQTLGYGVIVRNTLRHGYASCGMITLPAHRQKGVGRSIQLHLADICREEGRIPVSGCWYGNHLSKRTIESAGRFSGTRLLNITFPEAATQRQGS